MIDTPQVVETAVQPTAVIHLTVSSDAIRTVMGPGYRELMAAIAAQGVTPTGPWFTHQLKVPDDTFDFEIGVPVPAPIAAAGRVRPGRLPATTVARTVYHGPYEGLPEAWGQLRAWIDAEGHMPAPDLWEIYATGSETGPDGSKYRTELNWPLARRRGA